MDDKMDITHEERVIRHEHEHPTDIELHHDKVDPEAIGGLKQDLPTSKHTNG